MLWNLETEQRDDTRLRAVVTRMAAEGIARHLLKHADGRARTFTAGPCAVLPTSDSVSLPRVDLRASYRSNCVRHTLHDVLTTDAARDAQSLHLEPILSLPSLRLPALQPYIPRRPYRHLLDGLATYRAGCFAHLRSFAASPGALAAADGARSRRRRRVSALPPAVANYPFVHAFIITSEAFGSAPLRGLHTINFERATSDEEETVSLLRLPDLRLDSFRLRSFRNFSLLALYVLSGTWTAGSWRRIQQRGRR
ncbi:hypothetical protein RTBOTA2_003513 [Rhodotorula toruloides]|nr:hypothetical protein RTBOTA2_003513 [Rhodotorula toruloides]